MNPDGYPCFGGGIPVHLYVATAWVDGYFDGAEVHHIDGNRTNYDYTNLMWITHADNVAQAAMAGNMGASGENNPRAIETDETVGIIRRMYNSGMRVSDIVKELNHGLSMSNDLCEYKKVHHRYSRIVKMDTWQ